MRFRPCIDIHNGKVKQIVGASLRDAGSATVNSESEHDAAWFAGLYKKDGLSGAHVIMLNKAGTADYAKTKAEALSALKAYPGGLQIGGGINDETAGSFIDAGASHVIVTSFAFAGGEIRFDNLRKLKQAVGKEHVVLDLSAGIKDGKYYVVTDRWQKFSNQEVRKELFEELFDYCDEFLVHATNVEGMKMGPDFILAEELSMIPAKITYAGGITTMEDIAKIKDLSSGKLDFTVGSALDLFGGTLKYDELKMMK
ncbi:MAG: phosphoribosylformimino-5-aminoimidazole carboxamide ribotide isomerase [Lachnospiraceae bacterium]|nr:phosphoribosylformimino-5-aminoimidazole carboxamide ribotide isomerase [Lachnospiraceae bacterium]